jgi:uncharacterized damage-inducible protein DinB
MIDKQEVLVEVDDSTSNLLQTISDCSEENFNRNPCENCWSQAQVAEHILLLETKVNKALYEADATERNADLKVGLLKKAMASFERKFTAPEFIQPTDLQKNKQELADALLKQRHILRNIIHTTDLTETPTYKHPQIGDMTRLEWIYFIITHSDRHVQQMKNIDAQLAAL